MKTQAGPGRGCPRPPKTPQHLRLCPFLCLKLAEPTELSERHDPEHQLRSVRTEGPATQHIAVVLRIVPGAGPEPTDLPTPLSFLSCCPSFLCSDWSRRWFCKTLLCLGFPALPTEVICGFPLSICFWAAWGSLLPGAVGFPIDQCRLAPRPSLPSLG